MLTFLRTSHSRVCFNIEICSSAPMPCLIVRRRWDATPKIIMMFGALQLGMMAFAFQAPNVSKAMACA